MSNFNTSTPENLVYSNDIVQLTVLGGIKLEGLDRMRVTLKLELKNSGTPAIRHNMDLYNDTQLEKFVRRSAEKLEVGTSILLFTDLIDTDTAGSRENIQIDGVPELTFG